MRELRLAPAGFGRSGLCGAGMRDGVDASGLASRPERRRMSTSQQDLGADERRNGARGSRTKTLG